MASWLSTLPNASEFFPPSPQAFKLLSTSFRWLPAVCVTSSSQNPHEFLCYFQSSGPVSFPICYFHPSLRPQIHLAIPSYISKNQYETLQKASSILISTPLLTPKQFSILSWTPVGNLQYMGKTSTDSRFNLPGRYAWSVAELIAPLNLLYIISTLPSKLHPPPNASSSILGTGLPAKNELFAALYVLHYANRAVITPLFLTPSMSPIHSSIALAIAMFQYTNSSCIGSWLVYSEVTPSSSNSSFSAPISLIGLALFFLGLAGNIASENELFALRRGAAKRKAKSEGKAQITYDKVYVIPPASGWFKYVLSPHYVLEWLEWTGYWILGGGLGLGWNTPALWFLINEVATMSPRAVRSRKWYEKKFGKRAVAGRGGVAPVPWF